MNLRTFLNAKLNFLSFIFLGISLLFAGIQMNAQCVNNESIVLSPQPVGGVYAPGTVVTICYNVDYDGTASSSYVDGFEIVLGSSWSLATPFAAPAACGTPGTGAWIWQETLTAAGSGLTFGQGYYYDTNLNGDGGDDYGDQGSCTIGFCVQATVIDNSNLTVQVTTGGDGSMGSWNSDCTLIPFIFSPNGDADGDGFASALDCDDNNNLIFPGATELCDQLDNNCSGAADEGFDLDGDGFTTCNGDCNDNNVNVWIGASCNDGNPATGGDEIQADCSCQGIISLPGDEPWTAFAADPATGCVDVTVDPSIFTISTVVPAPGCAGNTVGGENNDIWIQLTVPANGELFLAPQGPGDAGMAAYLFNPTLSTYTLLDCDDDDDNNLVPNPGNTLMPVIYQTGLVPGSIVYVQLWSFNANNTLNFSFCASDCSAALAYYPDTDGDTFGDLNATPTLTCTPDPAWVLNSTDCDDASAAVNPGGTEICGNSIDEDCSGTDLSCNPNDVDGDGFDFTTDCNDNNPNIYPGATEYCDFEDNNCNTLVDEFCVSSDADFDGYDFFTDCDDNNFFVNPGAAEICDGLDNNCDGEIDEFVSTEYYADLDGDGFGDVNNTIFDCSQPAGYVTNFEDCDDLNVTYFDNDGDGDGSTTIDPCGVVSSADCDDLNPAVSSLAAEICENGIDDDCVGGDDVCVGIDLDADGFNAPADCNDNDASINPAAIEVCGDGIDQNCSGIADEGCSASDNDGDGFDALTDCNDNCATIYPGAPCNDGDAATVGEVLQADCSCGGGTTIVSCLGPQSISFEPAPTAGTWPVGTNVTICYSLDYGQNSGDWLDGMAITLGTGWSLASPLTAPLDCNGGTGAWIWQESIAPTGINAYPAGQGYYYDYFLDGNGGNDFGDAGSCQFSMCFTATTVAITDLGVSVASGGDSQFGNYSFGAGCPIEPFTVDPVSLPTCSVEFPFCATPSTCDPITNQYTIVQAQNNYINTSLAPATGTLDLLLDGNVIQSWNAPFNSVIPINATGLDSDGATHTLMAMFSANPGCMGTTTFVAPAFCAGQDDDADGFVAADDCNDQDATVNPGAPEICDLQDNNCDGVIDENQDADGDGFTSCDGDCNDADNTIWIGATCDDNDPNTTNDLIQTDCSCAGVIGDEPSNAFTADPTTGCIDILVDPALYTISTVVAAPGCAGNTVGSENPDVWISLTVPANGELFIAPQGNGDAGMAAYLFDPTTNVFTLLDCDDDDDMNVVPNPTNTLMPVIYQTGLVPGSLVFVQLWAYNAGNTLNFNFCASDCSTALAYYPDTDGDTFGDGTATPVLTCTPDAGWVTNNTDCDDASATAFPGGTEVCGDNIDNNCDGAVDEGCTTDIDADGFVTVEDCDDNNAAVYPGAVEICDIIDNNCDAVVDEGFDVDLDGFTSCNGDCNDNDPNIWIGHVCDDGNPATGGDEIQADCSCQGVISLPGDEPWTAFAADPATGCVDVTVDPSIFTISTVVPAPGCAGNTVGNENNDIWIQLAVPANGELFLAPQGAGDAGMAAYLYEPVQGIYTLLDCDDDDDLNVVPNPTNPLMPVIYQTGLVPGSIVYVQLWSFNANNTLSFSFCASDCSTALAYYPDADGDTFGDPNATPILTCTPDPSWVEDNSDCDDASATNYPGANEVCTDNVDNNCDGFVDEGCTTDADGDGDVDAVDCAPFNPNINSLAVEICNTVDDNCDGAVDNGLPTNTYYEDADGDTFGGTTSIQSCFNPNSPPVCLYTFNLTDTFGDGWNGNQMQVTSNGGSTIDATIGLTFTADFGAQESVLMSNNVAYDLTWSAVGLYTGEVGFDVLDPLGNIVYGLPSGSGASAGLYLTSFTATCPALGVYVTNNSDCDDTNANANPNGTEVCDNTIDEDCNGVVDVCNPVDGDGDGELTPTDCDDTNANINTSATDICGNGIDEDCSGADLACTGTDADGDGYESTVDCDDSNAAINPGEVEICNDIDDNCNTQIDESLSFVDYFTDADGDGYGDINAIAVTACLAPAGMVADNSDCDDTNLDINPGAQETCGDGVDSNCNGSVDETTGSAWYADTDADGFGDASASIVDCNAPVGYVLNSNDCDDNIATINPGAAEICGNGVDENCNPADDVCSVIDADNDGFNETLDCNDNNAAINPSATEICGNNIDEDCSGADLACTGIDADSDGFDAAVDCDDSNAAINPSATEICGNNIDEDCSGADLACTGTDADGDGFSTPLDCNDNNASIYPGAIEICFDNQDNNCNGGVDEGCVSNVDADGDGFVAGYDCDDTNPSVNPASAEFCNDIDDDCDGIVDDSTGVAFYQDADGDLLGNINATFLFCSQPANGWVSNTGDCDDSSASLLGPGTPCDNGSSLDITDTYQIDCTCEGLLLGCTDAQACNYNENAMVDDGSCVSSSYIPGAIDGNDLVDTYSYHNYSYTGNLNGVTLLWTLNSPGIFIPVSNTATTPSVNVYWSEGNAFDPQGEITLLLTDTTGGCNAQFEITFNVEFDTTNTGVDGLANQKLMEYPNPSNGNFAVVIPNDVSAQYGIAVYAVTGELVYTAQNETERVWNADLNLSSGLYMIKVIGEQSQHFINVVIEK